MYTIEWKFERRLDMFPWKVWYTDITPAFLGAGPWRRSLLGVARTENEARAIADAHAAAPDVAYTYTPKTLAGPTTKAAEIPPT